MSDQNGPWTSGNCLWVNDRNILITFMKDRNDGKKDQWSDMIDADQFDQWRPIQWIDMVRHRYEGNQTDKNNQPICPTGQYD